MIRARARAPETDSSQFQSGAEFETPISFSSAAKADLFSDFPIFPDFAYLHLGERDVSRYCLSAGAWKRIALIHSSQSCRYRDIQYYRYYFPGVDVSGAAYFSCEHVYVLFGMKPSESTTYTLPVKSSRPLIENIYYVKWKTYALHEYMWSGSYPINKYEEEKANRTSKKDVK